MIISHKFIEYNNSIYEYLEIMEGDLCIIFRLYNYYFSLKNSHLKKYDVILRKYNSSFRILDLLKKLSSFNLYKTIFIYSLSQPPLPQPFDIVSVAESKDVCIVFDYSTIKRYKIIVPDKDMKIILDNIISSIKYCTSCLWEENIKRFSVLNMQSIQLVKDILIKHFPKIYGS